MTLINSPFGPQSQRNPRSVSLAMAEKGRWIPACESRGLGRKPLGVILADRRIVLFRDGTGQPRALRDLCPHRGVPLSLGTCRSGRVVCPYHGWEFDGDGVCRLIPSDSGPTPPRPMVEAFQVRERDGMVEVLVPSGTPDNPHPPLGSQEVGALSPASPDHLATPPASPDGANPGTHKLDVDAESAPVEPLPDGNAPDESPPSCRSRKTASRASRRPRWATEADNRALIDLVRACPMKGSVEMYFDRAPDFFALCRLQGSGARVAVIDHAEPGRIAAAGAIASFPQLWVQGQIRQVAYACDLRVHPEARGGLALKRLYDFMTAWSLDQGWDLGFTAIMKGNQAMAAVLAGKGGVVPYHHVATMRNFTVQFLLRKRPPRSIEVRPATPGDIPDMVALWNRLQPYKQFAPVWTEADFARSLATHPGLAIDRYFLAFRENRLTGLLVAWNQEAFKRMVVLDYSPEMLRMRRWYNPLARILRLCPIPEVGQAMPYFYATHLCAETATDLEALYVHVYNLHRNPRTLFFSTMLDVRDPLLPALDGFMTQHVDIEIYLMDPHGRYRDEPFGSRPCYFDPAIV